MEESLLQLFSLVTSTTLRQTHTAAGVKMMYFHAQCFALN